MSERQPRTILVIDDDPVFRQWAMAVLRNAGYRVLTLAALADDELPPELYEADAILLDLALPGRDGFEVLDMLRADSAARTTPVLMLTAHDPVAYRLKGLALGADDYMVKPPNKQELLLRIQALLRRAGASEALRLAVDAADRSRVLLDLRDVVYVQAANNFCYVYVAERRYILSESLTTAAERLRPQLLRTHRSYLVNPARVLGVRKPTRSTLALEMDTSGRDLVPVGAQYRDGVRSALGM
ncbi:MAG: response regulator transcription factor [Coriobacteriia bacterium]|nr:response regulator transcription factor [Coriobacteriia bacterium]